MKDKKISLISPGGKTTVKRIRTKRGKERGRKRRRKNKGMKQRNNKV
jgi:hypothetical protein